MVDDEYRKIALFYEKLLGMFLYPIRRNISTFIRFHKHKKVIDICCGSGKQLEILRTPDMELYGVDKSAAMIGKAAYARNIRYILKDVLDFEIVNESFDAAILTLSLHEKNEMDRQIILEKSWNLVRPGGHLIVADYCRVSKTILGSIVAKTLIPLIERGAGKQHYLNYAGWMNNGALESAIEPIKARKDIISQHFFGIFMVCSIVKKPVNKRFLKLSI